MKGFLGAIAALGSFAVFLIVVSAVYGLIMGDTLEQIAPLVYWGMGIGFVAFLCYNLAMQIDRER